jgi:hypothetical protein
MCQYIYLGSPASFCKLDHSHPYTLHTQYSLTQPQLPGVQLQQLFSTSISFPELIFTSIARIKSHGTHLQQYCSHHQFSSSIMEQSSEKLRQPSLPAPPLIALIRHHWQSQQLMQLDIATLPVPGTLAIGVT